MANRKNTTGKGTFKATGAMPGTGTGYAVISEIMKVTGVRKQVMRTARTITLPLAFLTLCMLPSIAGALAVVGHVATVGIVGFVAYRLLTPGTGLSGGIAPRKSGRTITAEELAARKARAYSFGKQGQTSTTRSMTTN